MFLPKGGLIPVLPPTEESTCANSVVGTCTNGTPRNYRVLAVGIVGAMHELQIAWLDGSLGVSRRELVEELGFLVKAMVKGAAT